MALRFGRIAAVAALLASAAGAMPPAAHLPVYPRSAAPQIPAAPIMVILIRSTLTALSQANQTGDYTVLHALGSDTYRRANTTIRLAQVFAGFRANAIDISSVGYLNSELTRAPEMVGGRLHLVGYFPSQPVQINFDLLFEPSEAQWKIFGLGVSLSQAGTVH